MRLMRCNDYRLTGMRGIMFVWVLFTRVISDDRSWRKSISAPTPDCRHKLERGCPDEPSKRPDALVPMLE